MNFNFVLIGLSVIFKALNLVLFTTLLTLSKYCLALEAVYVGAFSEDDYTSTVIRQALAHTETGNEHTKLSTTAIVSFEKKKSLVATRPDIFRIGLSPKIRSIEEDPNLTVIPFPIMRGVVGYRVCFSHPDLSGKLNNVDGIDSLKDLMFGVGEEWFDKEIMNFNDLKNTSVGYYFLVNQQINSLYEMAALKRIDIFCRGINEVIQEYDRHPAIKKLVLNKSFALRYDMPFFLYVHNENQALKERLFKGLDIIFNNGVFDKLWKSEFQKSIDFVEMDKRKVIPIRNSESVIKFDVYAKYLYIQKASDR